MITNPIIPIWIMSIICIGILMIKKDENKFAKMRKILVVLLLFLINIRIMIPSEKVQVSTNNIDVLFVIDNTISMIAEDYSGNTSRLEVVQKDCEYIIEQLNGARFSVITFHDDSQVVIPYTRDVTTAIEAIKTITPINEINAKGSSLNAPIENMNYVLELSKKKENKYRVVFFISDGEITNDEQLKPFGELKKQIDNGAVLGYGTSQGGKMKVQDIYHNTQTYLEDRSNWPYTEAISKIDENNLKQISKDMEIDYIKMNKQEDINSKLKEIQKQMKNDDINEKNSYTDIYYIFAIPLCGLLAYELFNYKKKIAI